MSAASSSAISSGSRTHIRAGTFDVLGEAAVAVEADRGPGDAQRVLVAAAVVALPAEEADVGDDAVADGEPLDARADLDDLAGELVAERDRRLLARERVRRGQPG